MADLFVSNIPYDAEESELEHSFASRGFACEKVVIATDRITGQSRGFAFITLLEPDRRDEAIHEAIQAMDGSELLGRRLNVRIAMEDPKQSSSRSGRRHRR